MLTRSPSDIARDDNERLVTVQRVASALMSAVSFRDLGGVVVGPLATAAGAVMAVLAVRGELVASRGVAATDDVEGQARTLDTMAPRWESDARIGWLVASTLAVLPLETAGVRRGTLVLGFGPDVAPDHALCESLAAQLALAVARAAAYEDAVTERIRAEAGNDEQDRVLGHLAHELRNPLSPIITATQLMQLRAPDVAVKERATIARSAGRLVKLVDDLIDATRIARGKLEIQREPIAVSEVVERALDIAKPWLEERAHSVSVDVPALLLISADRERLAQALGQLLVNAAKYTERDGAIAVTAERTGELIALHVTDNGAGIPPELLPSMFDRFVQGTYGTRGGLGVGLAIARGIVELHGGTLEAVSTGPGSGSTFTITLPRWVSREAVEEIGALIVPTSRKILVVDDNQDAAWLLAEALRILGHDVRVSHDGAEALEVARRWLPEIAFLDIGLPGLDGFALCTQLAQLATKPRCVAVTGYGSERDRERAREAGFDRHFVKPVDLRDVREAIASFD